MKGYQSLFPFQEGEAETKGLAEEAKPEETPSATDEAPKEGEAPPPEGEAPIAEGAAPAEGGTPGEGQPPAEGGPPTEGQPPAEGQPPTEGEATAEGVEAPPEPPAEPTGIRQSIDRFQLLYSTSLLNKAFTCQDSPPLL